MESPTRPRALLECLTPSERISDVVKRYEKRLDEIEKAVTAPNPLPPTANYPPAIIAADIDILRLCRSGDSQSGSSSDSSRTSRFSHVTFTKTLGSGSFGCVYLAEHRTKATFSAVKVVRKAGMSESSRKLIISEQKMLKLLTELRHPFFLQLEESYHDSSFFYLITEYLPGGDLGLMLKRAPGHKFDHTLIRFCMTEIVCGTTYLHSLGIIHRDIKPENIFIDATGHLVIGDFGLATKIVDVDEGDPCAGDGTAESGVNPPHIRSGRTCGTPGFMAPELYLRQNNTFAADVWSIGVVMYLMVYGELPFDGETMRELIRETLYTPLNLRIFDNVCDYTSMGLLRALLNKDPDERMTLRSAAQHGYFQGVDWSVVEKRRARVEWDKLPLFLVAPTRSCTTTHSAVSEDVPIPVPEGRPYFPGTDPLQDFTFVALEMDVPLRPIIPSKKPNTFVVSLGRMRRVFRGDVKSLREGKGRCGVARQEDDDATVKCARRKAPLAENGAVREKWKQVSGTVTRASIRPPQSKLKDTQPITGSSSSRKEARRQPSFLRLFVREHECASTTSHHGGDKGNRQDVLDDCSEQNAAGATKLDPKVSHKKHEQQHGSWSTRRGSVLTACTVVDDDVEDSSTTGSSNKNPVRMPGTIAKFRTWGHRFRPRRVQNIE